MSDNPMPAPEPCSAGMNRGVILLVAIVTALAAAVAASGHDGWGWLLFFAFIIWANSED